MGTTELHSHFVIMHVFAREKGRRGGGKGEKIRGPRHPSSLWEIIGKSEVWQSDGPYPRARSQVRSLWYIVLRVSEEEW
jgi:hypothetical protein